MHACRSSDVDEDAREVEGRRTNVSTQLTPIMPKDVQAWLPELIDTQVLYLMQQEGWSERHVRDMLDGITRIRSSDGQKALFQKFAFKAIPSFTQSVSALQSEEVKVR